MDQLLSKAGSTLVTFAVRSGVQIASSYVMKSVSTLMDNVPEHQKKELDKKRNQLQDKIEIVTYSIEVVQLLAARGNSNLTSILRLSDYLKTDIDEFTKYIESFTSDIGDKKLNIDSIKLIEKTIDELIAKIDNIIPVLNLVLTTYGTSSVHNFQDYVSPGRLLNSTILVGKSNTEFSNVEANVGDPFSLVFYSIFYHPPTKDNGGNEITWREKYARCNFQIVRVPHKLLKYSYILKIKEDFNDDRYHDDDESGSEEEKTYDIRQIKKLFFSASGRLLKLEDKSTPVLVLKIKKITPKELDEEVIDGNTEELKSNSSTEEESNQYEWVALGDYDDMDISNSESDEVSDSDSDSETENEANVKPSISQKSPLSLLEYMIRLCSLQANNQISFLDVKDETLRSYLSDENHMMNKSGQMSSLNKNMDNLKI